MSILAKTYIIISIKHYKLSFNNYIFKLIDKYLVALFAFLVNLFFYTILVYNDLNKLIYLSKKLYIKSIKDLKVDKYYYLSASKKAYKLIIKLLK